MGGSQSQSKEEEEVRAVSVERSADEDGATKIIVSFSTSKLVITPLLFLCLVHRGFFEVHSGQGGW